jgi:hypothetical protein
MANRSKYLWTGPTLEQIRHSDIHCTDIDNAYLIEATERIAVFKIFRWNRSYDDVRSGLIDHDNVRSDLCSHPPGNWRHLSGTERNRQNCSETCEGRSGTMQKTTSLELLNTIILGTSTSIFSLFVWLHMELEMRAVLR